ncbi:MAG: hypothetical protein D6714_10025 [Bacteroidetes bacterium]|nr:MAG: hypothetical protein D6714_10025 [Bacteroidota bacterium]
MIKSLLPAFFFCLPFLLTAQNDLSGTWSGLLFQNDKPDTFYYQINLTQKGDDLSGYSFSKNKDGQTAAQFQLVGTKKDDLYVLQEVKQLFPDQPKWCLKYLSLNYSNGVLEGFWEADGCIPGTLRLTNAKFSSTPATAPFPLGHWTGQVAQSDRDYGFFYELDLEADGKGTSTIVSEGNGGTARHALEWHIDEDTGNLILSETKLLEKSSPDWRWCMKSGNLKVTRDDLKTTLSGPWWGYIEGYTPQTGPCAPGQMYLEQIAPTPAIEIPAIPAFQPYVDATARTVKTGRVLEVGRPDIRIKVWDNGIVDGDILTLFLNGRKILNEYRVSKRKFSINVKLHQGINYLILHAEDLGKISPNTVAVSVDDGIKEQIVILSSNLKESGAVMIRTFEIK